MYGPSTLPNFIHSLTKIRKDWRKFAFFADFLHSTIDVIHSSFQKRRKVRRNSFVVLFCKRQITIYYIYIKSLLLLKNHIIYKQKYLQPCKFVKNYYICSFDCIFPHKLLQTLNWILGYPLMQKYSIFLVLVFIFKVLDKYFTTTVWLYANLANISRKCR